MQGFLLLLLKVFKHFLTFSRLNDESVIWKSDFNTSKKKSNHDLSLSKIPAATSASWTFILKFKSFARALDEVHLKVCGVIPGRKRVRAAKRRRRRRSNNRSAVDYEPLIVDWRINRERKEEFNHFSIKTLPKVFCVRVCVTMLRIPFN